MSARSMTSISDLTMAWGRGWAVSRRTDAPVPIAGGYRIDSGYPREKVRHVFHTISAAEVRDFLGSHQVPGTWMKVMGPKELVTENLSSPWVLDAPGWIMSTLLGVSDVTVPDPYTSSVEREGDAFVVRVYGPDGGVAASGRCGPAGGYAVFDRISTDENHRRKGLGRVVMGLLALHATDQGASRGVLGATVDGKALYEALGWTTHAELTGAYVPIELLTLVLSSSPNQNKTTIDAHTTSTSSRDAYPTSTSFIGGVRIC